MRVLLDTNAYSHLLKGDHSVYGIIENAEIVLMSVFVIGELLYGFKKGSKEKKNVGQLNEFLSSPLVQTINSSINTAELFGSIKLQLASKGTAIPINDIWIAAHSKENKASLLTFDRHFKHVEGLELVVV